MILCSIFDKKAKSFGSPMVFENEAVAKRSVLASLNQDNIMFRFPEDYVLCIFCNYNISNSVTPIEYNDEPKNIEISAILKGEV